MAIFRRKREGASGPHGHFWRMGPLSNSSPDLLYQHGVTCVSTGDYRGAIATGWTLWHLVGLHSHQADDFLYDGYSNWRDAPDFDRDEAIAFLVDLFDELAATTPTAPTDTRNAPREQVAPAATAYSRRCFAGTELLTQAAAAGRDDVVRNFEERVYSAVTTAPVDFVPPMSWSWANDYAAANGLAPPFGA